MIFWEVRLVRWISTLVPWEVRLLRLLRFAARYDFQLHGTVLAAAEDLQVHQATVFVWVVPWCAVGMFGKLFSWAYVSLQLVSCFFPMAAVAFKLSRIVISAQTQVFWLYTSKMSYSEWLVNLPPRSRTPPSETRLH